MRLSLLVVTAVLAGCFGSSPPPGTGDVTIVEEDNPPPDLEPVPEEIPTGDPQSTCLAVANRLEQCSTQRMTRALDRLDPIQRAEAEVAIKEAQAGIDDMRHQCSKPLNEKDAAYVADMARCMNLTCAPLLTCVGQQ